VRRNSDTQGFVFGSWIQLYPGIPFVYFFFFFWLWWVSIWFLWDVYELTSLLFPLFLPYLLYSCTHIDLWRRFHSHVDLYTNFNKKGLGTVSTEFLFFFFLFQFLFRCKYSSGTIEPGYYGVRTWQSELAFALTAAWPRYLTRGGAFQGWADQLVRFQGFQGYVRSRRSCSWTILPIWSKKKYQSTRVSG